MMDPRMKRNLKYHIFYQVWVKRTVATDGSTLFYAQPHAEEVCR